MKVLNILAVSALIFGAPPMVSDVLPTNFGDFGATFAKANNNRGGNNTDRAAAQADRAASHAAAQAERTASRAAAQVARDAARAERAAAREARPINVHAQLKGLNSLNRNINGLMNSSDPKMDLFREFVTASADYEAALETLGEAFTDFDTDGSYQSLLDGLEMTVPTNADELGAMVEQLTALSTAEAPLAGDFADDQAYQDALIAWQSSTLTATEALTVYQGSDLFVAAGDAEATKEASSEEAMIEAMVAGLNATGAGPVAVEDMSPEMIEWVAGQLGVGETDGLIDAYMAQLEEDLIADEVAETDG